LDYPLASGKALKVVLESFNDRVGEQTAVVGKSGVPASAL
jgi:hypothetical protein